MPAPFAALRNRHGESLAATLHPAAGTRTLAVIAHGITSNKDRPYLIELAESLAGAGIPALRFTFSGHPGSDGRFEDVTASKEVDDLGCVLDAAQAAGFARVACLGHSLGGAVGLLRAARDERIAALVSLAGIVHLAHFMQRHFGALAAGDPLPGRPGFRLILITMPASRTASAISSASSRMANGATWHDRISPGSRGLGRSMCGPAPTPSPSCSMAGVRSA